VRCAGAGSAGAGAGAGGRDEGRRDDMVLKYIV
jgi:hypothetical protein